MRLFKNTFLTFLFLFSFTRSCFAQCSGLSIFVFPSTNYDCSTGQATVDYTINAYNGTGQVNAGPYTYTIVNANTSATMSAGTATALTGLTYTGSASSVPVGNYNMYVTSANGCQGFGSMSAVIPFSSANLIFTTTNVACYGGSNGAALASTNGPFLPPFTYTWSGPPTQTTQTAINLAAGVYSATIKDSKGCMVTNTVQITEPGQIFSTFSKTLVPCFGGTLNTAVTSTGGTSPYTYTVNGSALAATTASFIAAGVHTITTKDNNGCTRTNTILVSQVGQPVINFSTVSPLCPGSANGAASATISNAPGPYTYTWQPTSFNTFTTSINNIPAGNYTLSVKDASACITKSIVAVVPAVNITTTVSTKPENCSAVDGAATLSINGGNFPYTFTTIPIGPHPTNTITNLSSGTYTTIIKDGNNCIDSVVFTVGNLSTVSVSISSFTPVLCYNQCTGAVQISVQNAVPPVTYSASGSPTTTSNLIGSMCAGFHIIKVIDGIGCPATTTINFVSPAPFSFSATAPSGICYGKTINLQGFATGGAPGPYTYVWNPGNVNGQLVSVSPAATTAYSLNVYDSNNCTLPSYVFTVNVAPPLVININSSATGICPGTTAQITPTVTGGDGNYVYNWQPGNYSTASIFVQNVEIPTYTVTVNDGCGSPTAVSVVTINLFPVILPTYSIVTSTGCEPFCTQFINTTPKSSGAIWNYGDKPYEQQGNITTYCYEKAGLYNLKLTVTDSNNCKTAHTYTAAVSVLPSPKIQFITNPAIITLNNAENVQVQNNTSDATAFAWYINGLAYSMQREFNYSFSDTGCVMFKQVASNQNGCRDSLEKPICVLEGFNFWMPDCFTPNDDNLNEILIPKGTAWVEKNYRFEVFNRWGTRIFTTSDPYTGWNGKASGSYDPSNVYYWKVTVTDNLDETHEMKGHVLLLR